MPEQNSDASRDYLVDNIKALLITAVVAGHFMEAYIRQFAYMKAIFIGIYSFHMPLFVFISGYLSKSETSSNRYKLLTTILIPYIVFSFLWYARSGLHDRYLYLDLFSPPFHLWYLLSLFTWRLIAPFFKLIKHYLFVSIILALLAGFSIMVNNAFSMSRTIALFPFFLAGTACSSATLHSLHSKKNLAVAGIILLLALCYYVVQYNPLNWNIIFWGVSYKEAGYRVINGFLLRLALIITAALISLAVIVLSSSKKRFFTPLGAKTITIYIFHGFFVHPFARRFSTWHQSFFKDVVIVLFPFMLLYVLSLPVVTRLYHKFIDAINNFIINKQTAET